MAFRRGAAATLGRTCPSMSTGTAPVAATIMFAGGGVRSSDSLSYASIFSNSGAFRGTTVALKQKDGEAPITPPTQGGGKVAPAQVAAGGEGAEGKAVEKKQQANSAVDRREWRKFTATPWMMRNVISRQIGEEEQAPVTVLFSGDKLGPKPMLLLDGVAATLEDATTLLEPYVALMSTLNHKDGVICVPLLYNEQGGSGGGDRDALSAYCDTVVKALDALGITWPSVVIGRSVGSLVSAKMALLYPERVGGLVSLDTPLVSKVWNKNFESRSELLQLLASADTNVPLSVIKSHIEDIVASKEPAQAIQTPNHFRGSSSAKLQELQALSQKFYETKIFNEAAVFPTSTTLPAPTSGSSASKASFFLSDPAVKMVRETPGALRVDGRVDVSHGSPLAQVMFGTTDVEDLATEGGTSVSGSAYVSPADLASIAHPMLFVTVSGPSAGAPDADMLTHRALLNMRKPTVLKAVKGDVTIMEAITPPAASSSSSPTVEVTAAASELANQLRLFGQRFDLFSGLVRRFEQSASDLLKNMEGVKVVAGASIGGDKSAASKKKKGGEKGGEKKKP